MHKFDIKYDSILKEVISRRSPDFFWLEDDITRLQLETSLTVDQIQSWATIIRYINSQNKIDDYFKIKEEPVDQDLDIVFSRFYVAVFNVDIDLIRKFNKPNLEFMITNFSKNTGLGEFYLIFKGKLPSKEVSKKFSDLQGVIVYIQGFNDYDGDQKSVKALSRVVSRREVCDYEVCKGKCPSGLWDKALSDTHQPPSFHDDSNQYEIDFFKQLNNKVRKERDYFELQANQLRHELKKLECLIDENERLKGENKDLRDKCCLTLSVERLCRLNESLEVRLKMEEERSLKRPKTPLHESPVIILD